MSLHSSAGGGRRQKQLFNFLHAREFPLGKKKPTGSTKIKSRTCTLINKSEPLERRGDVYTEFLSPQDILRCTTYWEGKWNMKCFAKHFGFISHVEFEPTEGT